MSQNQMFCYQCEQTAKGTGCTVAGVCGKTPEVATLQDLLVYALRGLSQVAIEARKAKVNDEKIEPFIYEALFATLTNVNFDEEQIVKYIETKFGHRDQLKKKAQLASGCNWYAYECEAINMILEPTKEGLTAQGKLHGINSDRTVDPDLHSLQWLLTYGAKGVAAYAYHAFMLGKKDDKVIEFIQQALAAPLDKSLGVNDYVGLAMKCGEINIRAMELLDAGNTENYGHPVPTKVPLGHKKGKAILISGHDLI
ncbi:MAG: hydroxylamine reductase, partial [Candidatus Bathyarchaeota archaeon]|nr:hydroxylamine reductase [Candidatus Bathyarchaeota archaeon]